MKPARLLFPTALCTLLSLGAPLANAFQEDVQVARDMQFARELATRYAYVDYAEEVLTELGKRSLSNSASEGLELLRCDVFAAGANGAASIEERISLLEQALASYKKFLKDNPRSEHLARAERSYVGMVNVYGRLLEARLLDTLGSEREELSKKLANELQAGLDLTSDLLDQTADPTTSSEKNERYRLMLDRSQMYLTVGSVAEDGSYEFDRAIATLEELVGEAGELSGHGLSAFLMLAKVYAASGNLDDAVAYTEYVLGSVLPAPDEKAESGWDSLTRDERVQRWRLAELAAGGLIDGYRNLGDLETACSWALYYFNYLKSEAFPLSDIGNRALLAVATALLESNGSVGGAINSGELKWYATTEEMTADGNRGRNARTGLDLALSIAQEVNTAYKGKRSRLQVEAQKVISNIISRPGVSVSPEILLQAAEGDFNNKEYPKAIVSLKSILAELGTRDEATQRQYMPHALHYLGFAYARMGRHLEAAMTFREGVTTWKGDANWDERIARKYTSSISRVAKAAGDDARFKSMVAEAESILLSVASNTGDISFTQAERKYGAKDFAGARALYLQVEAGEPVHEKALMKAALCLYHKKDLVNARAEFQRFLEQHVTDKRNKPVGRAAMAARTESSSLATYYLGSMAFAANNHAETLKYLGDFHIKFETQESFCEIALSKVVQSHLASGDIESAKKSFAEQMERFPSSAQTGASAARLFQALNNKLALAEKAEDTELAGKLKQEMGTYRSISNDLATNPSYTNLRSEAAIWRDLADWERMERALRLVVKHFEDDADPKKDITKRVLPDLGLALLNQKRLPEAYKVLDPLVDKDPSTKLRMSAALTKRWSLAVTGWLEGDEQNIIEVPGTGGAKDLEVAARLLGKLTAALGNSKYEAPWYQLKFDTTYAYYVWSKEDSSKRETTRSLIENLKQRVGDDRLKDITKKTGDDLLRSRFMWLSGKVR